MNYFTLFLVQVARTTIPFKRGPMLSSPLPTEPANHPIKNAVVFFSNYGWHAGVLSSCSALARLVRLIRSTSCVWLLEVRLYLKVVRSGSQICTCLCPQTLWDDGISRTGRWPENWRWFVQALQEWRCVLLFVSRRFWNFNRIRLFSCPFLCLHLPVSNKRK